MQSTTVHRRSSTYNAPTPLTLIGYSADLYSDSRRHGYQGSTRNVRLHRATASGGGTIAKSEDGVRCVVAGKESLRILRLSDPSETPSADHKSSIGRGGHRIDSSRNLWDGSGLKIDSASTDVAWCHGTYNNKVLTSARNGDLIMWDLNKSGSTKYERKTKNHIRSIHKLSCSSIVHYYCVTGSADGDMRVWDLRDMSRSLMKIHHPTSVRSLVFSPCLSHPLQAVVGLDNGSIYRWDLQMGQRGQLDRLPVAHTGAILALDWCSPSRAHFGSSVSHEANIGTGAGIGGPGGESSGERSWILSAGLDHTVKVWDLSASSSSSLGTVAHIAHKPTYTLHPSFPVRRVLWRPDYPCELALVSNAEFGSGSGSELLASPRLSSASVNAGLDSLNGLNMGAGGGAMGILGGVSKHENVNEGKGTGAAGDAIEIWDVRRGWVAKWIVEAPSSEGGVTDLEFRDSHAVWAQHSSGTFAQLDLRNSVKPIDAVSRVALAWSVHGSSEGYEGIGEGALAFVADKEGKWEVPYDDVHPEKRHFMRERKINAKALGDAPRIPGQQSLGTFVRTPRAVDTEEDRDSNVFAMLARRYIVDDNDRRRMCSMNAEIAIEVGNVQAAQVWLLLGSLLTDIVPDWMCPIPSRSSSPPPTATQPIPLLHSISAPAALPSVGTFNIKLMGNPIPRETSTPASVSTMTSKHPSTHATSSESVFKPSQSKSGPSPAPTSTSTSNKSRSPSQNHGQNSRSSSIKPPPNSRNLTPVSSASSSPRRASVALPPSTMMTSTPRRPSILVSGVTARRPSVYTRSSTTQSESPSDSTRSGSQSLRHVGEGALDDSDSSEGSGDDEEVFKSNASDEEGIAAGEGTLISPQMRAATKIAPAHPSPLSRLAGQHRWTEDEDEGDREGEVEDEASPSPGSTDTDSDSADSEGSGGSTSARRNVRVRKTSSTSRSRSRRNSAATRIKSRSRSSTVVSLAAPAISSTIAPGTTPNPRTQHPLAKQSSQSSIRTIIAGDASVREQELASSVRDDKRSGDGGSRAHDANANDGECSDAQVEVEMSELRREVVTTEEALLRDAGWRALRDTLEDFADKGDVQMCAMLSIVAARELQISPGRVLRFLESYVDILMRLQLHTCAAYLRKHTEVDDVRNTSKLETVIYTACGRCRKPMTATSKSKGAYTLCAACQAVVRCSICHLPVRTLLFQCSVCTHGGHQECYWQYYMTRPMVELGLPLASRGRTIAREEDGDEGGEGPTRPAASMWRNEAGIVGHPCAAGCGHFCWAAARREEGEV
ncbi:hypothetical protein BV22DRAFT_1067906 [Leucogyrophana mollusca]|uniref:Uncharacterized protein n=1 Tax=Leucogyrophana mollusca TaxID=85980 RepID=A0ACB8BGC2_9AGAM|nr:hypothetical protein BV22DRAFT_1067906 [Leucogyrophana mollusca]